MRNGVMATLNDAVDFDTAAIIASEFDVEVEEEAAPSTTTSIKSQRELSDKARSRPPVVAVMGHVDHGKTTLLDTIRKASVASGEAGGITQHISAYQIEYKDRPITFLDTPGHEAFAALRQHGAALTDVAVIVVAANDGVMPQTKEAIEFVKRSGVNIVVAINKIDAPGADPNRTKQQLSELNVLPEEWGGDTVMVEISALKNTNIDALLDMVLLVADIDEHKAEVDVPAEGIVIEAHTATGKGPIATVLVEHGTLKVGSFLVAGGAYAKIRALEDDRGQAIESAGPSSPATIIGFKDVPVFGQRFQEVETEKEARKLAEKAKAEATKKTTTVVKSATEGDVLAQLDAERSSQNLNVVLKADVQGSLESIIQSLEGIGNEEASIKVIASGVGDVSESDITAAEASGGIVYAFHSGVSSSVKRQAARSNVEVRMYDVIYELLDDAKSDLEKLLKPEVIETEIGTLKIKGVFRVTQKQLICGGQVTEGTISTPATAIIRRDDETLGQAELISLQKGQETAKEALKGDMCGLELRTENKVNAKEGDRITFVQYETKQKKL